MRPRIEKTAYSVILPGLIFACVFFAGSISAFSAGDNAKVISAVRPKANSLIDVKIDRGVLDGVMPGVEFDVIRAGKTLGRVSIYGSAAKVSAGKFKPECEGCEPEAGDEARVRIEEGRGGAPAIVIPNGKLSLAGGPEGFDELGAAFRMFMSDEYAPELAPDSERDRALEREIAELRSKIEPELPECPPGAVEDLFPDLNSEYFLESGDRLVVTDWPPYSPFCPEVDADGVVKFPVVHAMSANRRTIARLERALRDKLKEKDVDVSPSLFPLKSSASIDNQ